MSYYISRRGCGFRLDNFCFRKCLDHCTLQIITDPGGWCKDAALARELFASRSLGPLPSRWQLSQLWPGGGVEIEEIIQVFKLFEDVQRTYSIIASCFLVPGDMSLIGPKATAEGEVWFWDSSSLWQALALWKGSNMSAYCGIL